MDRAHPQPRQAQHKAVAERRAAPQDDSPQSLIGAWVRVVTRRGQSLEGVCLDAWQLRSGGTALKIRPDDGSPLREVTTLLPVDVRRERERRLG